MTKKSFTLFSILLLAASAASAQLNVYFIDVGQGDATYLELPNGSNVLIDGGPKSLPVLEFLYSKGVTKIDHMVLTHPHNDHYRGLKKVFQNLQVNNFYDTRAENPDAKGDNTLREQAALEPGCTTHFPEVGQHLNWDKHVTVKVLNTCSEVVVTHDNAELNNCSLALRFFYNGHGLLMMGDAEAAVENALMKIFKSGLNSTYLKVSHHGSRYSSTEKFLARVQPKVAVISFGEGNSYGHPHKEAMDRLTATGAQLFTTQYGTQSLTIPAPKRGVEPVFNGEVEFPVTLVPAPEFRVTDYQLTPEDAAAMRQLSESAR